MENVTKSIIYGNMYENRYGKFLPVCSSISDRASIQSILDYLQETPHFKKYNRIAYAYRVQEAPIVFITEKKNVENQHYDGSHSDQTIQGSGEKLLHLLQKFNVRNVFIAILIQQFNPLFPFETTNYRAIVQNCRLLLDDLYKKVVALQDNAEIKSFNDLLLHNNQTTKLKKCNMGQNIDIPVSTQKKIIIKQRPNHVHSTTKPQFLNPNNTRSNESSIIYQIKFLWQRCKLMKQQFQNLQKSIDQKEVQQLKYYAMYDKNQLINQIIKLFSIYLQVDRNYIMNQYNFEQIKQIKFQIIEEKVLKKLDDTLKSNKKLNIDTIMKNNRPVGVLFGIIQLKLRFSKTLKRISQLMEKSSLTEKELEEIQKIKRKNQTHSFLDKVSSISLAKTEKGSLNQTEIKLSKS